MTVHRINKQIRELFKEITSVREDLKEESDYKERRLLRRREKNLGRRISQNSKAYYLAELSNE